MPCWSKEKGSKIIKPDDGVHEVLCHEIYLKVEREVTMKKQQSPRSLAKTWATSAELRATSSSSSAHHGGESWRRPWVISLPKLSGVTKQRSKGVFSTSPKAKQRC